jgi:L-lactate dehydrogenase complex protein LldG
VVAVPPVSPAREAVLARIRSATAGASAPIPAAGSYRRKGKLEPAARIELLCERLADYRAEVRRVSEAELAAAIAEALGARGARRIGIPAGLPAAWRPAGFALVVDEGLSAVELAALDGVLTGCTLAVAETGTLVLAAGPSEGRRALTLVPDLHVCVVCEEQIVELLPEATETLGALARERRPLTLVSGPSATSDIELARVEGVHGPRTLVVLVTVKEST